MTKGPSINVSYFLITLYIYIIPYNKFARDTTNQQSLTTQVCPIKKKTCIKNKNKILRESCEAIKIEKSYDKVP